MGTSGAKRILLRGVKLRCPDCGLGPLYRSPFRMHAQCEYCDLIYEREQGYFIGAIYLNVIATDLDRACFGSPARLFSSQSKSVAVPRPHPESKRTTHQARKR
jgi:rubredoxin